MTIELSKFQQNVALRKKWVAKIAQRIEALYQEFGMPANTVKGYDAYKQLGTSYIPEATEIAELSWAWPWEEFDSKDKEYAKAYIDINMKAFSIVKKIPEYVSATQLKPDTVKANIQFVKEFLVDVKQDPDALQISVLVANQLLTESIKLIINAQKDGPREEYKEQIKEIFSLKRELSALLYSNKKLPDDVKLSFTDLEAYFLNRYDKKEFLGFWQSEDSYSRTDKLCHTMLCYDDIVQFGYIRQNPTIDGFPSIQKGDLGKAVVKINERLKPPTSTTKLVIHQNQQRQLPAQRKGVVTVGAGVPEGQRHYEKERPNSGFFEFHKNK